MSKKWPTMYDVYENPVPVESNPGTATREEFKLSVGKDGRKCLTNSFMKSFTEHGYVIGVMCARYNHTYQQGLQRMWSRKNRLDYYFPILANIGEQPIYSREIYYDNDGFGSLDNVFGYQEAWADYRYKTSIVTGEMRSGITNSLQSWHFADYYAQKPTLSSEWIQEDKTNVDRTLAVTSTLADQIFGDFYVKNLTTRVMPVHSIPGLHTL